MTTLDAPPARSALPRPSAPPPQAALETDWVARVQKLGPAFAARAAQHDQSDAFVAENYMDLRTARVFSAGIPACLGGGDVSFGELCEIVGALAPYCSSTALALATHFQLVAELVWKWRHQKAPVEALLRRIAEKQLVLVSSSSADGLYSSGTAEAVKGGYRVRARKVFPIGVPVGDWLMTSAVYEDPNAGSIVLHFPISLRSPGITIISSRRNPGMRQGGANEVLIENVFVPEEGISVRRPCGRWHFDLHLGAKTALPLLYSVYFGMARAARNLALREAQTKREQPESQQLAGQMENALFNCQLAHQRLVEFGSYGHPGEETTNALLMARTLAAESAIATVGKAVELVGGKSFYRSLGLERLAREVQSARFHPMPEKPQQLCSGRLAFGLHMDGI